VCTHSVPDSGDIPPGGFQQAPTRAVSCPYVVSFLCSSRSYASWDALLVCFIGMRSGRGVCLSLVLSCFGEAFEALSSLLVCWFARFPVSIAPSLPGHGQHTLTLRPSRICTNLHLCIACTQSTRQPGSGLSHPVKRPTAPAMPRCAKPCCPADAFGSRRFHPIFSLYCCIYYLFLFVTGVKRYEY
jgi:hypothetical protein